MISSTAPQTTRGLSPFSRSENGTVPFANAVPFANRSENATVSRSRPGRLLAALALALVLGCGSAAEPPVAPAPEGRDATAVPPAQMRMILEGLTSSHARAQFAALETLSRYPAVVATYREHVERLEKEGKDDRVRKKAAELLASRDE